MNKFSLSLKRSFACQGGNLGTTEEERERERERTEKRTEEKQGDLSNLEEGKAKKELSVPALCKLSCNRPRRGRGIRLRFCCVLNPRQS